VEEDNRRGESETRTGVRVFDELTAAQKIALLADVAMALRDAACPAPAHTIATDSAVAAVFARVREVLEHELDGETERGDETLIRGLIRGAYRGSADRSQRLPPATRKNPEDWELLLEGVEARLHWEQNDGRGVYDAPPAAPPSTRRRKGYYHTAPREPDEAGVIAARQVLARLLDWPVPDDTGLYPTLIDYYHEFTVGPLPPDVAEEWPDHPWVHSVSVVFPRWDCDYSTWQREVRPAVPDEPFTVRPTAPEPAPQQKRSGRPKAVPMVLLTPVLPAGMRVERCGAQWVLCHAGGYWSDMVCNRWGEQEDALRFASEEEARRVYTQVARMYDARRERRGAMCERLGLSEPDPA
jgi:hypothetical protein